MPIPGLGYYNNYGAYANALSDDFMASQYFRQLADTAQNGISGYYSTGSYSNQPQTDTFEKQESSSNFGKGLLYGGLTGAATGTGVYYLGTKPVGETELTKGFANEFNKQYVKNLKSKAMEEALKSRNLKKETIENLLEFSKSGDTTKLSKDASDYLTSKGLAGNKDDAAKALKEINDEIAGKVDIHDVNLQNQKLAKYKNLEDKFKALTDTKKSTLEKFLIENAEEFGLKGADDAATKLKVQNYMGTLKTSQIKSKIKSTISTQITNQKNSVKQAQNIYDDVFKLWNKDKKLFNAGATDEITKACENGLKNFKLKTAGKWGAIAAGAVALGTWLFGGSSKTQA